MAKPYLETFFPFTKKEELGDLKMGNLAYELSMQLLFCKHPDLLVTYSNKVRGTSHSSGISYLDILQ